MSDIDEDKGSYFYIYNSFILTPLKRDSAGRLRMIVRFLKSGSWIIYYKKTATNVRKTKQIELQKNAA